MKINWGTAIVLAFIGFIAFIMYFVISMLTNDKYEHDLVVENYYQQELQFQKSIEKEENANNLSEHITWKKTTEGMLISFPKNIDANEINGKVFLYRPSNKQLDFEMPISLSNHTLLVPDNRLLDGRWNLSVEWEYQNTEYLFKEDIMY